MELKHGVFVDKFRAVRHYDGMPLDARTITTQISALESK